MFSGVLICPLRAWVFLLSGGVLFVPVGRALVSFGCRLMGWFAFRFSFVVVVCKRWRLVFLVCHVQMVCAPPFMPRWCVFRGAFA